MTTMRSCSGIKSARIRSSVVFPVPVPPLIRSVLPLRICSAKKSAKRPRQRAASDQIINCVMAAGEFPDDERRCTAHDRRDDFRQPTPVRELCVQEWVVLFELLTQLISNNFEAGL
jgi:hypothetical protein